MTIDEYALIADLFGKKRSESRPSSTTTSTIMAEAVSNSSDGSVQVRLPGDLTGGEDGIVTIPTEAHILDGDVVSVSLVGGVAKAPRVTGTVGGGDRIYADVVETRLLLADKASVDDLEAATARIGDLEATSLTADSAIITSLEAEAAKVENLTAAQLEAANAYIAALTAGSVTASDLIADNAKLGNLTAEQLEAASAYIAALTADNVTAANLVADHAAVSNLDTNYAQIDMANVNNAWIENGLIKDAAITNEMVGSLSANKLTSGTIDAANINVTNLRADNLKVTRINGQPVIGGYSLVNQKAPGYDEMDPHVQGWYELTVNGYILTSDTAVVPDKAYYTTSNSVELYDQDYIDGLAEDLNDRIDGAIETHTGTVVPTLNNSPASAWNTTDLKDEHVGDVYYVVNSQSQQNGYCYRFTKSGSTYSWELIKDSDVTAALSRLQTAEGKIGQIETFDSTVSSFMTDTDSELTSVKNRTTSLETRVTTAEGNISNKVDTSVFNTVSQKVDTNEANITSLSTVVTNNGLTESTNISSTVNTVSQTATGNSSKISQLTTTLGTNADGTTKAGDIVHRASAVEQDLSGFKTTVSQTYATKTELNNIEIGGRNLLRRTANPSIGDMSNGYWEKWSANDTVEKTADGIKITCAGNVTAFRIPLVYEGAISAGETLTLSFDYRGNMTGTGALYMMCNPAPNVSAAMNALVESTTNWVHFEQTFSFSSTGGGPSLQFMLPYKQQTDKWFEIKDGTLKLERGNKATDWTPAPEDIETRMTSAESSITQNANNIALKVSESDVTGNYLVGKINLDATTATIAASKVNIAGAAIFQSGGYLNQDSLDAAYDAAGSASIAQTAATNAAKNYTDTSLTSYSTTSQMNTAIGNAVDGIEVGGRNLLKFTASPIYAGENTEANRENGWCRWNNSFTVDRTTDGIKGTWGDGTTGFVIPFIYDDVVDTDEVVLSFDYRTNATSFGPIYYLCRTTPNVTKSVSFIPTVNETVWQHAEIKFAMGTHGDRKAYALLYPYVNQNGKWLEIRDGSMKLERGNKATDWTPAPEDFTTSINAANSEEQLIYKQAVSGTSSMSGTTTWVTATGESVTSDTAGLTPVWTTKRPTYRSNYPVLFVATQRKTVGGTVTCTTPMIDDTTTVINGGNIITGSVTANKLDATNINASGTLTIGALSSATQADVLNSNIEFGGRNLVTIDARGRGVSTDAESTYARGGKICATNVIFEDRTLIPARTGNTSVPYTAENTTGAQVTLSFDYKLGSGGTSRTIAVYPYQSTGLATKANLPSFTPTNEWQHYSATTNVYRWTTGNGSTVHGSSYTPQAAGGTEYRTNGEIWAWDGAGTNTYIIKNVKLEKGNVATDWTPASEDMATASESVEYISGTQTAKTGSWSGVTKDSTLYTGKTIAYKLPYAGDGNATLNLILGNYDAPSNWTDDATGSDVTGINLLKNSATMSVGTSSWANGVWRIAGSSGGMTKSRVEIADGPNGSCYGVQGVGTQTLTTDMTCWCIDGMTRTNGAYYQFSMYARVVGGGVAMAGFCIYNAQYISHENATETWETATYRAKTLNPNGEWTRVWCTIRSTAASGNIYIGVAANDSSDKTVQICNVKIEKLNVSSAPVYSMTTRVTTHYPANSIIQMTYDGENWRTTGWYNTDTVNRTRWQNVIKAAAAITNGYVICGTESGYKNVAASVDFDLAYPLLYCATTKAAGETSDNNYLQINGIKITNNGTVTSAANYKTVYLMGTVSGNTFTVKASPFMTTVIPTEEDGYYYIPLGMFYNSTTAIYFNSSSRLYAFFDGRFQEVGAGARGIAENAYETAGNAILNVRQTQRIYYRGTTQANPTAPTEWVTETGDVFGAWTQKVPPLMNGTDKYPYLWTCEQSENGTGIISCTAILLDASSVYIDGSALIAGSVTANAIAGKAIAVGNLSDAVIERINQAGETASKFLVFDDDEGILEIGDSSSNDVPKMQLTSSQLRFVIQSAVMATFGQNASTSSWEMTIDQARIDDMLHFGGFTWVSRQNGNMSLKWIGGAS